LYDTPDFDFTISGNIYLFIYGTPSSPIQLYAGRWYWLAFEGNADMDSASNGIPGIKQAGLQTPYGRSNISSPYELGSRAKVTGHALARSYGPFPGTFPAGNQPIGPSTYNTAGFYAPAIVPEILMQFSN
jgi:hypothetical protein